MVAEQPWLMADAINAQSHACGCVSCAVACDGDGLVLGPAQTLHFDLAGAVPPRGTFGAMVRARGFGVVTVTVVSAGAEIPFGQIALGPDFTETLAAGGQGIPLGPSGVHPEAVELHTNDSTTVEVDCVVPYAAP